MKKYFQSSLVLFILFDVALLFGQTSQSSNSETLLSDNTTVQHVSRPAMIFTPIQNQVAGLIGFTSGLYLNNSFYVGLSGYANLTHSKVNSGMLGVEIENTINPENLVHFGYSLFAGIGFVKDYQQKNGLLDDFLNIFGTQFYFAQPSVLLEINFDSFTRIAIGAGYRFVAGLNEMNKDISISKLQNRDLNNLTFFINLKTIYF